MYHAAMPAQHYMKGISRKDQPENQTHGFYVRLKRDGKIYSAFFADNSHGGREKALAAAQQHCEKLTAKFKPAEKPVQRKWRQEAVGGRWASNPARPPDLDPSQLIWVQCRGYRCMAYRNANGRWVNFYTGKVLADVVKPVY